MLLVGKRQKPLIVILGPTAIGKTGLAIELAKSIDGEIIGADSRQIYRHMDIGTAKPSADERAQIPHHLIDIIEPDGDLSLALYQNMTYETVDDIHERGKIPLLVGGTGQYLTAITEGWSIPEVPPNMDLRAELDEFAEKNGVQALYERLEIIDPEAAVKIHPNNVRRVVRALEVYMETGTRISDLQRKKPPPYDILELGLTMERPLLWERADRRIDMMMDNGFLDEVRRLLDMGYNRKLPSLSGLGYAQLVKHLLGDLPLETAVQDTKTVTHGFIRRQFTWFRGHDNGILWHNVEQMSKETIIATNIRWLEE
jgi:tRNA dimethylallyltransferase